MIKSIFSLAAALSALSACTASSPAPSTPPIGLAGSMRSTLAHDPSSISLAPHAASPQNTQPPTPAYTLSGKVGEVIEHGGLTYAYVHPAKRSPIWVAYVGTPVKVGDNLTLSVSADLKQFHAKSLGKTFDRILLGTQVKPTH